MVIECLQFLITSSFTISIGIYNLINYFLVLLLVLVIAEREPKAKPNN